MADNVAITAGSGTTIATDEVGAAHYQIVKLALGADGAVDGHLDAGQTTASASLPVVLASDTDFVKAEDAAHSSGDKGIPALTKRAAVAASSAGSDGDYAMLNTDALGQVWTRTGEHGRTRVSLRVAVSASQTGATVWDPTGGTKFVLTKLVFSAATAGAIQFFDQTDSGNTVISPILTLAAGGGYMCEWPADWPYRSAAADNVLKYTTGTVITGSVYVEGWEE